jgi:uncharacterized protein YdaU (DUF1376 family)
MSEAPYMKFWFGDYYGRTHFLSLAEHGAYLMLLKEAWQTPSCSLPDDPAWLKRRLAVSDDEFEKIVRPVIDEFWTKENHRIYQSRQRKEYEDMVERSESAKMSANRRWSGRKVIPLKPKENT